MVGRPDDGVGPTRGWGVFDPIANAQALAEVQAQALRAAGELVERLARSVDGAADPSAPTSNGAVRDGATTPAGDALRLVETWIELLQRASTSFAHAMNGQDGERARDGERIDIELGGDASHGAVRIELTDVGNAQVATAEAWLHNGTPNAVGPLRLRAGELCAADGAALAATVVCDPAQIDALPGRSSRGIVVSVRRGRSAAQPGTYRGLIQVEGASSVFVTVEVVVWGTNGSA